VKKAAATAPNRRVAVSGGQALFVMMGNGQPRADARIGLETRGHRPFDESRPAYSSSSPFPKRKKGRQDRRQGWPAKSEVLTSSTKRARETPVFGGRGTRCGSAGAMRRS